MSHTTSFQGNGFEINSDLQNYLGRARLHEVSLKECRDDGIRTLKGEISLYRGAQLIDGLFLTHVDPFITVKKITLCVNSELIPLPIIVSDRTCGDYLLPEKFNLIAGKIPIFELPYTMFTVIVETEPIPESHLGLFFRVGITQQHLFVKDFVISNKDTFIEWLTEDCGLFIKDQCVAVLKR